MKKIITLFLMLGSFGLYAQEGSNGKIEEIKDPEIDQLISKRSELYGQPRSTKGFRVLIYNGEDRETYINMKQKYLDLYPGDKTYLTYEVPNFQLKVGDCTTYREALELRKKLSGEFKGAVVVEDRIRVNN